MSALPSIGNELLTVYNRRALPILSILPTIYIVISIFENKKLNSFGLIMLITQIAILMFVFHSRSSVFYQFIFIYASFFLVLLLGKKLKLNNFIIKKSALLSIFLVTFAILFLKGYLYISKDPQYSNYTSGHLFWHAAYLGLSSHPESVSKYGIYQHDQVAVDFVAAKSKERFGTNDWYGIGGYTLYEDILKIEYLSILKNDPTYILKNYALKPLMFIKSFFNSHYWLNNNTISMASIIGTIFGGFLLSSVAIKVILRSSLLLIGAFSFSFIPAMLLSAKLDYHILDSAVIFLTAIYWTYTLIIGFFIYTIKYLYYKRKRVKHEK